MVIAETESVLRDVGEDVDTPSSNLGERECHMSVRFRFLISQRLH